MLTTNPLNPLDWNEENLERAISDLYRDIKADENLRQQLIADPFEVLSARIALSESYRGGILIVPKGQDTTALYVPTPPAQRASVPSGTVEKIPQKNYQVLCTVGTLW